MDIQDKLVSNAWDHARISRGEAMWWSKFSGLASKEAESNWSQFWRSLKFIYWARRQNRKAENA
ncbi:MAG: hypothetical protein ACK5KM_06285 [Hyphomicrobiaceae bacterium]